VQVRLYQLPRRVLTFLTVLLTVLKGGDGSGVATTILTEDVGGSARPSPAELPIFHCKNRKQLEELGRLTGAVISTAASGVYQHDFSEAIPRVDYTVHDSLKQDLSAHSEVRESSKNRPRGILTPGYSMLIPTVYVMP